MSKTLRDQALEVIKNKQSVVINGKQYTLDNIDELPPLEDMVAGDANQEAQALETLKKEKEELEKRLAAMEGKSHTKSETHHEKKATKATDESESK